METQFFGIFLFSFVLTDSESVSEIEHSQLSVGNAFCECRNF